MIGFRSRAFSGSQRVNEVTDVLLQTRTRVEGTTFLADAERTVPNSNAVQDPHPLPRQNMTGEQSPTFVKGNFDFG